MKKHSKKLLPAILAFVLLALALDCNLAQPEKSGPGQDKFIGFFLAYENSGRFDRDLSLWTEYGSDKMELGGLGKVSVPRHILIGSQEEPHGPFVFPGMEGYNCFLALFSYEDGSQYYTGYTDMADCSVHIKEGDTNTYTLDGTVYFGPPLDDSNWNTEHYDYFWTAYRVYQMPDETVYLDGSGNSFGGVGGFTISEKTEHSSTINGKATTETTEITVKFESIPRLAQVAVQQYNANDQLLRTDTITSQQAALQEAQTLELTQETDTAYVLVVETDVDGNAVRSVYNAPKEQENRNIVFTSWFLNDEGMGYALPVRLLRS